MGLLTNVYVDGFNLYFGLLRGEPNRKWLDLDKLARTIRKRDRIKRIRYFSAPVNGATDADEPIRQHTYFRALRTLPTISIHLGQFQENHALRPLADPIVCRQCGSTDFPRHARIREHKEKGTDVSLATMLLCDAFSNDFEQAIVVSNDSDLALPIEMVRVRFQLKIGVLSPRPSVTARLQKAATFCGALRAGAIEACQFPEMIADAHGTITKPAHW